MKKRLSISLALLISLMSLYACQKEANSEPKFIFKPESQTGEVLKIGETSLTYDQVFGDIKGDIFEKEMELHDLKMAKVKAKILEILIEKDERKKGLSNDQFLDKYIAKDLKVSEKAVNEFVEERKIPANQMNDQLKEKIKSYLLVEKKRDAVDLWIAKMTQKNPAIISLNKPERPKYDVIIHENDASWGNKDSKVTIVEYSDFQCPFCAKAADRLKEIKKEYGKKVHIVFKQFPLPFHNHAKDASIASLCAKEQGEKYFWKAHDHMFAHQGQLDTEGLTKMATAVGLDNKKFETCLTSDAFAKQVERDVKEGKEIFVKSTPTFFINGHLINGAQPIEVFKEEIDKILK